MLTVWGRTSSVNVQKVLWCLAELDLEYERIDAGLEFGKNHEDWFLEMNPNGKVPVLRDGAFTLWESNSIVRYLCAKFSAGGLYPASLERRADAERWMDWQLSTLARPAAVAFWGLMRTAPEQRDRAAIERAVAETNDALLLLDRHLTRNDYAAGANFTMGDIPVGALTHRWLALPGIERPAFTGLERWYGRLMEREGFRRHVMLPLR
jgi:glutathione S-transferase